MSAFTDYTENALLSHIFKDITWAKPSTIYVGLFTGAPGEDTPVENECVYTGYARVDAAAGSAIETGWSGITDADTGAGRQVTNAKAITFGANAGIDPVTITHLGVFDALTSGNLLFHASLSSSKTLNTGDVLSFSIGSIKIAID